jgi:hypothetical protein
VISSHLDGELRPVERGDSTVDESAAVVEIEDVDGRVVLQEKARAGALASRHREVHFATPQLGYYRVQRIGIARRVAKLQHEVLSLDIAALA